MEDETDSTDIPRSAGSDPSGFRSGFKLSGKLRARIEKLGKWRIPPSSIKSPEDAREFHGGHATVSKAFLLHNDSKRYRRGKSFNPREVLELCRQSPQSYDHFRGAAGHRGNDEWELGDEEKDVTQEYGPDSAGFWRGKFVAVKKMRVADDTDLERELGLALRETEFLAQLSHPNIVKVKGFVEDLSKDIIWLVFPWAENGNLQDFVASRDWEIPERISLIDDVASGLEYLHSQEPPVCHGDLKSFNVLVSSEHRAVITDFGSARRLTEHDLNRQPGPVQNQQQSLQAKFCSLSKTITITGNMYTLRWAAPELLNDDQMSLWSDIWALGWIAYEVLTNSIPFQDVQAEITVVERVINGDLPSINDHARVSLFEKLCSLMTMCWNSNPSERPTAKDYVHAVGDMPMVVPKKAYWSGSTVSRTSSSEVLIDRGKREQMSGDFVMAVACFTEAHRIYIKIGDRRGETNALDCLASLPLNRKEYSEAIKPYSEALQSNTNPGDMEGRASALSGLAGVYLLRNEYSEAIARLSEVLQIRTDMGDRAGQASALSSLAQVHQLRMEYSAAIKLYSEALQIRPDVNDSAGKASALSSLAQVPWLRNEYSQAIKLYSEALQIYTDIGDRTGQAYALPSPAQILQLKSEDKLYSKLFQIHPDDGNSLSEAFALSSLARVHLNRKEYSEAIKLYSKALQIRPNASNIVGKASALSSLAQVHQLQNEYSEAMKLYSEAMELYSEAWQIRLIVDASLGKASVLSNLAREDGLRNEYSEGIMVYSEELQIHTDIDDMEDRVSALWGLAEVHRLRNEYSEAFARYSEVLQIRTDMGDRAGQTSALLRLAEVHQRREEYFEAIKIYSKVLQIYNMGAIRAFTRWVSARSTALYHDVRHTTHCTIC